MKKRLFIIIPILIGLGILAYFSNDFSSHNPVTNQPNDELNPEVATSTTYGYEEEDRAAPHDIILGKFKLEDLNSGINKEWFEHNYNTFSVDAAIAEQIGENLKGKNLKIRVFMGTWCADSQLEVPALIKILDKVGFDRSLVTYEGVDKDKNLQDVSEQEREALGVYNVPTIIVYDESGKEMNRFVEFPQETLEEDLLKIFSGEEYKHAYDF